MYLLGAYKLETLQGDLGCNRRVGGFPQGRNVNDVTNEGKS